MAASETSTSTPQENTTSRARLLVVDDQPIIALLLNQIFLDDYDVQIAHSGAEALTYCKTWLPDLILLDVVMPVMDGHEVCRRLKANPLTRDIPVMFVTGFTDPKEESIGLELGAVDFISKPVNPAVVRARVRTHLKLKFQAETLELINQTLESRIAERSAELKTAMGHLLQTEKLASLGSMVAGITHELATPLSNMRLAATSLTEYVHKVKTDIKGGALTRSGLERFITFCSDTTDLIDRSARRSEALLLSFKQVSVDQTSERRCHFDLRKIVEHTVHVLGPTLKTTPYKLITEIPPEIILNSFPGAIEQIITNLVNNSLAHAFPERTEGCMIIYAQLAGDLLAIVYTDDGIGIPAPIGLRIFDPFFTTKAGRGGSGLGMYTVYQLVTGLLGGTIEVGADGGCGAVFTIRLNYSALQ
jgi:signal transduction histidine kinase